MNSFTRVHQISTKHNWNKLQKYRMMKYKGIVDTSNKDKIDLHDMLHLNRNWTELGDAWFDQP